MNNKIVLAGSCLTVALSAIAGEPEWPAVTREAKPWVYNWWMGSAVDEKGLENQCEKLEKAGFGGFHVIPIYGAKGYEKQFKDMLSDEWIDAWNMAADKARAHNLGIDLTMGCGWCFGGPWITDEDACSSKFKVKRSGPGGHGMHLDPFSPKAMSNHVARFEAAFGKNGRARKPRAFYHDSYEYYGSKPKNGGDVDELQLATFKVWTDWCRERGYLTRNEGHGAPSNWLDFYALADIPETEMFREECRDILISKFASSAAHIKGTKLVSAESCTWLGEHFTEALVDYKKFIDRLFLAGVNHMFYHGCCYSPVDAKWPGWCFYASSEMNWRNPIWHDVEFLSAYIARCQSMFQTCEVDNDTLVYWPIDDYRAKVPYCKQLTVHNAEEWFHPQPIGTVARRLYQNGRCFDYVSDRMLQTRDLSRYCELVIPPCEKMPAATKAAVAKFRNRPTREEPFTSAGLNFLRFKRGGDAVYFLANVSELLYERKLLPSCGKGRAWFMNPMTGKIREVTMDDEGVKIELNGFETTFLVVRPSEAPLDEASKVVGFRPYASILKTLKGEWRVEPVEGGPNMPAPRMMKTLTNWSINADGSENPFSGTMRYTLTFDCPEVSARPMKIDFGMVKNSLRAKLNGREIGFAFMAPYAIEFDGAVMKKKGNVLEVEVTNLGANRIRYNDRNGIIWRNFYDINFCSSKYGKFDASEWPLRESGLLGPVQLLK